MPFHLNSDVQASFTKPFGLSIASNKYLIEIFKSWSILQFKSQATKLAQSSQLEICNDQVI